MLQVEIGQTFPGKQKISGKTKNGKRRGANTSADFDRPIFPPGPPARDRPRSMAAPSDPSETAKAVERRARVNPSRRRSLASHMLPSLHVIASCCQNTR